MYFQGTHDLKKGACPIHFGHGKLEDQSPNLMNLSRVWNPPKTGFNLAPA